MNMYNVCFILGYHYLGEHTTNFKIGKAQPRYSKISFSVHSFEWRNVHLYLVNMFMKCLNQSTKLTTKTYFNQKSLTFE